MTNEHDGHPPDEIAEPVHYEADPDDPELNPDVERASEIDDVTGPVPRIDGTAGGDGDASGAGDDTEETPAIDPELAAALAERDELKALAQRIQADFDNYRKRAATQSLAEADRATGRIVEALLPVLDAAEAAYVQHPDEVGPLLNAMLGELRKHGLETLDLEGRPFDPEVAESVAHEPGEGGDLLVADVLRSGYRWKGRTLRAAMVRTKD
jgi:molecular chaperone GrpE